MQTQTTLRWQTRRGRAELRCETCGHRRVLKTPVLPVQVEGRRKA